MTIETSDGKSTSLPTVDLITQNTAVSESGEAQPNLPSHKKHLGDHDCRTFAFVGGKEPHFIFSSKEGWGRFYVTNTQVALCVEDCAGYIGDVVRSTSERS